MSGTVKLSYVEPASGAVPIAMPEAFAHLDTGCLIESYPGPAIFVGAEGDILATNAAATDLTELLSQPDGEALRLAIVNAAVAGEASNLRLATEQNGNNHVYDLALLPTARLGRDTTEVLIVGREATLEHNLTPRTIERSSTEVIQ